MKKYKILRQSRGDTPSSEPHRFLTETEPACALQPCATDNHRSLPILKSGWSIYKGNPCKTKPNPQGHLQESVNFSGTRLEGACGLRFS